MDKIDKILVPIDFSEISERASALARFMAEHFKSEILFIHVVEDVAAYSGFAESALPYIEFQEANIANSQKLLKEFTDEHFAKSTVSFQCHVLHGRVAEEIIEYSKTNDIGLITMGAHSYGGLKKMFIGSVTNKVLKLAPCPVLTTR